MAAGRQRTRPETPVTFLINPGEELWAAGHGTTFYPCHP
jgi:hypothetical protein